MQNTVQRVTGWRTQKKPAYTGGWSGNGLVSHGAAPTVSSELKSLTAVFEMGTGVPSSLLSPVHLHIQAVPLTGDILLQHEQLVNSFFHRTTIFDTFDPLQ